MKIITGLVMTAVLALPALLSAQSNEWTAHEVTGTPQFLDGTVVKPNLNPVEGSTVAVIPGLCDADPLTGGIAGCFFGMLADPATGVVNESTIDCQSEFIGLNLEDLITPGAGANINSIDTFTDNMDGTITMALRVETEGMFPLDSDMFMGNTGQLIYIGFFMGENTGALQGLQTDKDLFVLAATFDTFDIDGNSESGGMPFDFDPDALGVFFGAPGPWLGSIGIVFTGPDDDLDGIADPTALNTAFAYELTVTYEGELPSCAGDDPVDCVVGDLTGDGIVTLLDVQPFVDAVLSGTFSCEADVNEDTVVSLLDVQPFVDILLGG